MLSTSQVIAVAVGGACGSVLRVGLSHWVQTGVGRAFPYGTLSVNVLGCFVMGLLFVWFAERSPYGVWSAGLLAGLLGGFTTFSAFSMDTLRLMESGAHGQAFTNVAASVVLCLSATWLGLLLARST